MRDPLTWSFPLGRMFGIRINVHASAAGGAGRPDRSGDDRQGCGGHVSRSLGDGGTPGPVRSAARTWPLLCRPLGRRRRRRGPALAAGRTGPVRRAAYAAGELDHGPGRTGREPGSVHRRRRRRCSPAWSRRSTHWMRVMPSNPNFLTGATGLTSQVGISTYSRCDRSRQAGGEGRERPPKARTRPGTDGSCRPQPCPPRPRRP